MIFYCVIDSVWLEFVKKALSMVEDKFVEDCEDHSDHNFIASLVNPFHR